MSPGRELDPAAVALGLLDERERAAAERRMAADPQFAREVERLRATATALSELDVTGWRPPAPPPLDDDHAVTLRPPRAARRRTWGLAGAGAAVAALAAVAVVIVLATGGGDDAGAERTIALRALAGVPGEAELRIRGDQAELRGQGMPPSGPHDYYEAWLADARGRMVSMGSFRVAGDGRVEAHMPIAVDLRDYRVVDVSLEPDDGDPAHSARSVMRARLPV